MGNDIKKKKKTSKRKKSKSLKIVIILFSFIILLGILGYFYLLGFTNNSRLGEGKINTKKAEAGEPVNILVMGVDIGDPGSKEASDPKRTDTMLVINYNPKTKNINMVSVPRDTRVTMNGKKIKINSAHAINGVNGSIAAVENLLGIEINNYAKIDYEGFRKVIDAIGGVEMDITRNMNYDDPSQNLHIHFQKGTTVHLDGKKAEEFFRWRKNNNGTGFADGDLGRIENQHKFISKVVEKVKSPSIIPKIPSILSTIPDYIETDMSPEEIIKYGYAVTKGDKSSINMITLQGEAKYIGNVSYFIYDREKNRDIVYTLKTGGTAQKDNNTEIDKSEIKIKVLNGTKVNGLAADCERKLKEMGYSNIVTGNGERRDFTKVRLKKDSSISTGEIENYLNIPNIEKNIQSDENFDIIILLGKDFANNRN
ncbi:LCP family protein [Clostridium sporogenes]|uniref:LytR family transcriptional regulator n=2 Tax=Clostridium TaxID=1485 RepID=A0A7X5P6P7_CLOSG|nr:LCP family protein [Clostridium sporogenes]AJD32836.1 cell envelope-related function transcriptional attenuator common domain protein [Clostridium botulinum Prevot_594]AVP61007.1 LytR family transcriptional regulator [Clostridium botulinum]AKC63792.1 transcriptional regulator LytR [Clostridium sporogenes]AKJ90942.1 transcriptional regulator [Clostridium sporogenes]AVP64230.1 LytR family transcriptional regulator [Clostridium botulinum]